LDALSVRDQFSVNWSAGKHIYEGCGTGSNPEAAKEAADADLRPKISAATLEVERLGGEDGVMRAMWLGISCEFDNSPEGAHLTHPCKCNTCRPGSDRPPACGDQCCTECETCQNGTCVPMCNACQSCQGGRCVDICGMYCDPSTSTS
jgi:hypothetical protein